jgi:hypothetical protein
MAGESMSGASEQVRPPRWAEGVLLLLLEPKHRDSVSGDLLEEYREVVQPARGSRGADLWYVRQVGGFLWRQTGIWSVLFSGAFIIRTAYDWLDPVDDFHGRATLSTAIGGGVLFAAAFVAAWRARSISAGPLAAIATSQIAAILSVIGVASLLVLRHDPQIWSAIERSGGLAEAFALPFMVMIPGIVIGVAAGVTGKLFRMASSH